MENRGGLVFSTSPIIGIELNFVVRHSGSLLIVIGKNSNLLRCFYRFFYCILELIFLYYV